MNENDEYKMLREEIMENMKTQQQLSTSALGLTVGVLTLVGSFNAVNSYLFLLPLLLLLPSAVKIKELRDGIMTLSGYLIARHESKSNNPYWEATLNQYRRKYSKNRSKVMIILECGEFAISGIICAALYINASIDRILSLDPIPIIFCCISFLAIFFLFYLTFDYQNMDFSQIEEKIKRWEDILRERDK